MNLVTIAADLLEAQDPSVSYTYKKTKGEITKVIASIEGNQSGVMTRLLKPYKELKDKVEALARAQDEMNDQVRQAAEALFDAGDAAYTRVVETVSMTVTLSKKTGPTTKTTTDYEAVVRALAEMVPELSSQIQELIDANTKITQVAEKAAGVRVQFKEGVGDWITKAKSLIKGAASKFTNWVTGYDRKLARVAAMVNKL